VGSAALYQRLGWLPLGDPRRIAGLAGLSSAMCSASGAPMPPVSIV
jgi:hypothetical protein